MASRIRRLFVAGLFLLAGASALLWFVVEYTNVLPRDAAQHIKNVLHGDERLDGDRTPGELLRHAEKRLSGHTTLETVFLPVVHFAQSRIERAIPEIGSRTLGKGQQPVSLPATPAAGTKRLVGTADELRAAIGTATAGQVIEVMPGRYRFKQKLMTVRAGTPEQPIVVRATQPGQVDIEFDTEEGFHVTQPHWHFENLHIKGVCGEDRYCEHAFHVVGDARQTIIRNNRIEDFNAHIKVNGLGGQWPDDGVLEFNTLTNTRRRETHLPVTPFDLVGASRWRVSDNLVSNFVKGDGDKVSYGIFMKGAGREGRIERNLVICTLSGMSQPGVRVGISFGGGGTGQSYCRDGGCKAEHFAGLVSNNVVAHCNDFGIDVFRASKTIVAHNTLINTAGIDVRVEPASALVYANLLEGRIRARNAGQLKNEMNEVVDMASVFRAPDSLDLTIKSPLENIPSLPAVADDFCRTVRASGSWPGAFAGAPGCADQPR